MGVDARVVGAALADVWEFLMPAIPSGWARRAPGAIGGVTHVGVPTLNGVWVHGTAGSDEVSTLLDAVAEEGVPYCLQLCQGADGRLRDLARSRLMLREADVPLMVLGDVSRLPEVAGGALAIRALEPHDAILHADLAAAGFQAPAEWFRRLMTPSVLGLPGVRTYLGEADGQPVTTCVGFRLNEHVGIFNVATLPTHQRRGYGAAITAWAVRDGFAHGARWAWLQSSAAGLGVYERLGFATLESWECWISS
jgi:GNAT superfamily N-acetyltransferase